MQAAPCTEPTGMVTFVARVLITFHSADIQVNAEAQVLTVLGTEEAAVNKTTFADLKTILGKGQIKS